jgi:hypothetical protein
VLSIDLPFSNWEISKFNTLFSRQLEQLGQTVDPSWERNASRIVDILPKLDQRFYVNETSNMLEAVRLKDPTAMLTLFVIEASATLGELENRLLGG